MEDLEILLLIPFALLFCIILANYYGDNYYTYVDSNNNTGKAEYCHTDGLMYCRLEDNTTIQVIEFRSINE